MIEEARPARMGSRGKNEEVKFDGLLDCLKVSVADSQLTFTPLLRQQTHRKQELHLSL